MKVTTQTNGHRTIPDTENKHYQYSAGKEDTRDEMHQLTKYVVA